MTSLLLGEVCADGCFFSEQKEGNIDFLVYAKYQKSCLGERQKRGCSACSGGGEAAEGLGLGGRASPSLPSSLSLSLCVCVCLYVGLCLCLCLSLSLFLSLCSSVSVCLSLTLSLSLRLSVSMSLCVSVSVLSLCMSPCVCVCLCLSVLSLSRSVCLSVSLSLSLSLPAGSGLLAPEPDCSELGGAVKGSCDSWALVCGAKSTEAAEPRALGVLECRASPCLCHNRLWGTDVLIPG